MTEYKLCRPSAMLHLRRLFVVGCLGLDVVQPCTSSARQSVAPTEISELTQAQLQADERLGATLSLSAEDMRLDDASTVLGGGTGLRIQVSAALAPRKASMRVVGRPAFAVMAALSHVFCASWRRVDRGYEFFQTDEQIDLESRQKRASAAREAAFVESQLDLLRSDLSAELLRTDGERNPLADFIAGCEPAAVRAGFASALEDEPIISATDQSHFLNHFFDRKPYSALSPRQQQAVSRIARGLRHDDPSPDTQVGLVAACGGFRLGIARPDGSDLWVAPGFSIGHASVLSREIRESDFDKRVSDTIANVSCCNLSGIRQEVRRAHVGIQSNPDLTRLSATLKAVAGQSGLEYISDGFLNSSYSTYLRYPNAVPAIETAEHALGAISRVFTHKMDVRSGILCVITLTPGLDLRLEPPAAVINSLDNLAKTGKQPTRADLLILAQCSREELILLLLRHPVVRKTHTGHLTQAVRVYPFLRLYGLLTEEQRAQAQSEDGLSLARLT
jgi:hypothetical protein